MAGSLRSVDVDAVQEAIAVLDEAGFDVRGIGAGRPTSHGVEFELTVAMATRSQGLGVGSNGGAGAVGQTNGVHIDDGVSANEESDDADSAAPDSEADDDRDSADVVEEWARERLAAEGRIEATSTDIADELGVAGQAVPWALKRLDAQVEKVETEGPSGSKWVVEGAGDDDSAGEGANPYEPDDLGTLSVRRNADGRVHVNVLRRVVRHFDADRIHVRRRDGRVEMAPGGHDDWPDYAANRTEITLSNQRVTRELLDVVPGDEVRADPDGDVVVLEPNRCAERDRFVDCGPGTTGQYGRQKVLSLPIEAERLLDDPDHVYLCETETGYEVRPGEHDDWPTYSQASVNSKVRLGAQAIELLDIAMGEEVRARGDREREVIELAPPDGEFSDPDESDAGDGVWRDYNGTSEPDDECENCGAELVEGYAAVFEPDDGDSVRCCPNCEDKIRERDGTVRPKRNVAGGDDD